MSFEQRLIDLGYHIEPAVQIPGKPLKAIKTGNLIYTSGQLSVKEGQEMKGRIGKELTIIQGQDAAKLATLNCLAAIKSLTGTLDEIVSIIKVFGMVNVAADFNDNPDHDTSKVIDGCSDLLHEIFGDVGKHARSAVGMSLPRNFAVEIEMIVEVG